MRKILFIVPVSLFLVFTSAKPGIRIHEDNTYQTGLDQLQLCMRLVGIWQQYIGKDTIGIWEVQQFEKAFVSNAYLVVNGKRSFTFSQNWGFSSGENRFRGYELYSGGGYRTFYFSFVSEEKMILEWVRNFDPGSVTGWSTAVFETPDECKIINFNKEGIPVGGYKLFKIK